MGGGGDDTANESIIGSGDDALLCRYFTGRRKLSAQDQLTLEFAAGDGVVRLQRFKARQAEALGPVGAAPLEARSSCASADKRVRLERQTAPTEGIGLVGLETLDDLATGTPGTS